MKQETDIRRAFLRKINEIVQKCLPALLPLCSWRIAKPLSQENFAQNSAHDIAGRFIFDQNTPEIHAFRFGKNRADAAGCGPIAVYNALLLTGKGVGFSEVIRRMEQKGGAVRGGVWGANPAAIARVLPLFGIQPRHCKTPEQLASALENGYAAIMMIWNDKNDLRRGAHFFTVQKTAGGYQAYNRFSGQKTPFTRAHFSEILANARYLSGYALSFAGPATASPVFSAIPPSPAPPSSPAKETRA